MEKGCPRHGHCEENLIIKRRCRAVPCIASTEVLTGSSQGNNKSLTLSFFFCF